MWLTGAEAKAPFKTPSQGKQTLARALAHKACLVVADDVWDARHLEAFNCLTAGKGLLLFTSRFDLAESQARTVKVNVIRDPKGPLARAMLLSYALNPSLSPAGGPGVAEAKSADRAGQQDGEAPNPEEDTAVGDLLLLCKGLPMAIAIVGALKRVYGPGTSWVQLLAHVRRRRGEALIFPPNADATGLSIYSGLHQALEASVEHLRTSSNRHDRLAASLLGFYGVWPEDTWMDLKVVAGPWGLPSLEEAKDVLTCLASRSLIEVDGSWRSVVHDLLRDYLRSKEGEAGMAEKHLATIAGGCRGKQGEGEQGGLKLGPTSAFDDSIKFQGTQWYPERHIWHHLDAAIAIMGAGDDMALALSEIWPRVTHLFSNKSLEPCPRTGRSRLALIFGGHRYSTLLQGLTLWSNQVRDEGVRVLGASLSTCTRLERLYLRPNMIGDEGATALAGGFKHCPGLYYLNLGTNKVGDEGAIALGREIGKCTALRALYLDVNEIGDKGAVALANGLEKSHNLLVVKLAFNKIGEEGGFVLLEKVSWDPHMSTERPFRSVESIRYTEGRVEPDLDLSHNLITARTIKAQTKAIWKARARGYSVGEGRHT